MLAPPRTHTAREEECKAEQHHDHDAKLLSLALKLPSIAPMAPMAPLSPLAESTTDALSDIVSDDSPKRRTRAQRRSSFAQHLGANLARSQETAARLAQKSAEYAQVRGRTQSAPARGRGCPA